MTATATRARRTPRHAHTLTTDVQHWLAADGWVSCDQTVRIVSCDCGYVSSITTTREA